MGIFSNLGPGLINGFGGGSSSSASGINALPQWAQQALQGVYTQAQGVAGNTANYAPIPFNPTQSSALSALSNYNLNPQIAQPGALGFSKGAQAAFSGAQNFANQIPGQIDQSNNYLGQAGQNINAGTQLNSPGAINSSINSFMNPYIQDAINPAVKNINMEGDYLGSQIAGQAANAGAFGGTRQALAEGLNNYNTQQQIGNTVGNLLNTGYNTASNLGLSNLQNERQNFLTGAGLNIGQSSNALSGANAYATGANALTNLGNSDLSGWQTNVNNSINLANQASGAYSNAANLANTQLGAGNVLQQPAQQTQQIPFAQLQTLMSSLGILPQSSQGNGSQQGSVFGNNGAIPSTILGQILSGFGGAASTGIPAGGFAAATGVPFAGAALAL